MKSHITRVLGLLALMFLTGFAAEAAAASWAESYGVGSYDSTGKPTEDPHIGSGNDVPRAIAPMPDGGFVVAGQIAFPYLTLASSGGPSDAVMMRFAPDG